MEINFNTMLGIGGYILALVIGLIRFFSKREVDRSDAAHAQSQQNANEIVLMKQTIAQMEIDIERIERTSNESVKALSTKLDQVLTAIQNIQISCSAHLAREASIAQFLQIQQKEFGQ